MKKQQHLPNQPISTGILILLFLFAFAAVPAAVVAQDIIHVDADAGGANDGTSWTDAYTTLQDALAAASSDDEIWVAEGVYFPDEGAGQTDNDRSATFQLINGVEIYGGFAGGESTLGERDVDANPTILSGDIDADSGGEDTTTGGVVTDTGDISGSNSFHVVTGSGTDGTALLDGFTVTAGLADGGIFPDREGGGMFNDNGSPALADLTFIGNSASAVGGGMHNRNTSHPTLTNVVFSGNSAFGGGGMKNIFGSNPTLTNVSFTGNSARDDGGGMDNTSSHPTLTNVTFIGNSADNNGGGMINEGSDPTLTNVTFSGNSADNNGGGLFNFTSNPSLTNVIIWDNEAGGVTTSTSASIFNNSSTPVISHSLIANSGGSSNWDTALGTNNGNNIDRDPLFTDPADPDGADDTFATGDDGLHLANASPAINEGDNSAIPSGVTTDLAGNDRIRYTTVDMGAYEWEWNGGSTVFVDKNATGNNTGESWTDAFNSLQDGLVTARVANSDIDEIWVADGVYHPDEGAGQTDNDRGATFQLINGVKVYGGFAGGESTLGERDVDANPTILSGDIDGDDDPFEPETDSDSDPDTPTQTDHINGNNSFHVVTGSGTDGTALLDGFTVTAGLADGGIFPDEEGGGMLNVDGSPALANITFNGNSARAGAGMVNELESNPTLTNVTFSGNSAVHNGGGMANDDSSPTLTNVTFIGNSAGDGIGGGMLNVLSSNPTLTNVVFSGNSASQGGGMENVENSSPTLTNVIFSGNSAGGDFGGSGGGMRNRNDSSPTLTNVTFIGNSADNNGGGLFNFTSNPSLTNVIIWDNEAGGVTTSTSASIFNSSSTPVISHSLIANSEVSGSWNSDLGTDSGGNIIDREPLFRDASDPDGVDDMFGTSDDGLQLANASPAINGGTNDPFGSGEVADGVTTDLAGNDRIRYTTVDMGAYEWEWNGGSTVFVDKNATGNNTGESWDDAFNDLQDGLATARVANSDIDQVWVADGVYHPDEGADQTDNDRGATFQLINGVEIYGGFAGDESALGERDVDANPTILSGDIDGNDTITDGVVTDTDDISGSNSYHVVTGSGTDDTARLDGFTITAGLANIASGGTDAFGAGMLNENGSPALAGLTFSGNSARRSGGGMVNNFSSPTLTNVTFSDNSSGEEGGGMFNRISHPTLTNVTFIGNSADGEFGGSGGGMFNDDSSPTLTNVTFSGNSASSIGGGMLNADDSHPTLTNVAFSGNSAGSNGGGLFNAGNNPTLTNVTFSGNSAGSDGGGMLNGSSDPTLTNVTFSGNSAGSDGGGMLNVGSDPTLTNVIIWNNEAGGVSTSTSASIFNFDDFSNPVISHSLIANSGGSGTDWEGALGTDDGGNIDADPLLTDPTDPDGADDTFGTEDDGLHLANASPAINGGTNDPFDGGVADGVTTDLAGNDRIRYTTVDMGAYEWEWNGGSTVFVDKNATGSNTGESWEDAFTDLQDALPIAPDIDEVWVANGVYTPTDNTDERDATFQLSSGLAVYGGFAGGEPNREDRDWGANPTILSGDIGGDDISINGVVTDPDNISGNNSYQVVTGSGTNNTAILDGFTITAGNADGSSPKDLGGGMYNNDGSPTLFNISIIGNSAAFGGGIFNENSSPDLVNFLITGNSSGTDGGAMVNFGNSHSVLTNGTFTGNSADDEGGAIYNEGGDPTLTNVIIWDNQANGSTTSGAASISNVISDPAISHSLIDNSGGSGGSWNTDIGNDGGGNIDADPLFTDPTDPDGADDMFGTSDDGLALQDGSPAINGGTNDPFDPGGVAEGITTDLAGNTRIFDSTVDMGAYENQSVPIQPDGDNILYVDQNVAGGNQSGDSWANAIPELWDALDWADENWDGDADGTLQIWVADALYLPTGDDSDRDATFQLVNNVEIYGGFDGGEGNLSDRDVDTNPTILSGDIDGDDDPFAPDTDSDGNSDTPSQTDHIVGGNSFHVVTGSGTDGTALLDGFTITAGLADGTSPPDNDGGGMLNDDGSPALANLVFSGNSAGENGGGDGGGMFNTNSSNPTLTNVTFSGNSAGDFITTNIGDGRGGGMFNENESHPTLTEVTFSGNSTDGRGGGMGNFDSSPTLTNVTFTGNSAGSDGSDGGGMFNVDSSPTLTNVTFTGNSATDLGGGIYNRIDSSPTLTNVTFTGNSAGTFGGGMVNLNNSNPTLTKVIIWNNEADGVTTSTSASIFNDSSIPDIFHSLIANSGGSGTGWEDAIGTDGGDNIDTDPLFVDPTDPDGADDTFGTSDDGLALQNISPAINAGDPSTDLSLFPGGPGDPLDLAGNPRVFDGAADPDIIDMGAYEFQGEPFVPEADNGRVLASNLNGYTFTPAGFGQSDTDASVIVKTLPSNGDLELDGSAVTAADEIPVGDIDDGKLTYMPTAGDHGVNYDSFDFTVKESGIESDPFTMTIDVGTASLELTGGEGWRFLGNPSDGDSYDDLLSPIWTKGVPGSDSPGALFANVFNLDQSNYQWEALADMSNTVPRGEAFIVYVYSDDDNNGTPDSFPKTLTSGESWQPLSDEFSYSGLDYDPDQGSEGNSHFLIANPHPVSLDFCGFTSTNVANSVNIWDPAANGGNGDYVDLSCGVDDVFIAPFQGFWVRTTDPNPVLEIPEAAYLESAEGGYFKQPSKGSEPLEGLALTFTVQSEDNIFTNTARILFSEEASVGLDEWDAPKLSPAGLASRWLSFYSLDVDGLSSEALAKEGRTYALQNLPTDFGEKISIPLDIQTTEPGRYTLNWNLPESHVLNGSYFLQDNRTGTVIELREGSSYSFEITDVVKAKESPLAGGSFSPTHPLTPSSGPRFELLIAQAGIDGFTELGAVPEEFTLAQNYPNPFNPTTVISYQLPVNSEVRLEVFDMLGRNVATLVNGQVAAGRHTVNFDASNLSSGVYLYRLAAGSTIMTKKLTVVK